MYLLLIVVVVIALVAVVMVRRSAREERLTRDLGTELGGMADRLKLEVLVLEEDEQRTAVDKLLAGSRLDRPVTNGQASFDRVICGPLHGYQVTLFDFRDSKTGNNAFTVLVLRAAGLPRFQLEAPGSKLPPHESEGLRLLEPERSLLFNESFRLEVHEDDRERLKQLLQGPAMAFFEARLDARLVVESLGDRLLIYEARRVLTATQAETLLNRSTELADALTGRVRPPPPEPPPEPPRPQPPRGGG